MNTFRARGTVNCLIVTAHIRQRRSDDRECPLAIELRRLVFGNRRLRRSHDVRETFETEVGMLTRACTVLCWLVRDERI